MKKILENNYKALYDFIDKYDEIGGYWHIDKKHKGTSNDPIQMPFVVYNELTEQFVEAFYSNIKPDGEYLSNIKKIGNFDDLLEKDLSCYDLEQLVTILTCIIRQEKFCEGLLLKSIESGLVLSVLKAMKYNCEEKQ